MNTFSENVGSHRLRFFFFLYTTKTAANIFLSLESYYCSLFSFGFRLLTSYDMFTRLKSTQRQMLVGVFILYFCLQIFGRIKKFK